MQVPNPCLLENVRPHKSGVPQRSVSRVRAIIVRKSGLHSSTRQCALSPCFPQLGQMGLQFPHYFLRLRFRQLNTESVVLRHGLRRGRDSKPDCYETLGSRDKRWQNALM
jgi:hypothetical protein